MRWRRLGLNDMDAVMALRTEVLEALPDPDYYVREDNEEEFVRGHLDDIGMSWGVEAGGRIVAYCSLTTDLEACGEDREFEVCSPCAEDAILASMMVLPSFRGHSLQREAIHLRLRTAAEQGYSRCLVQVSPKNVYSLRSLFAAGFLLSHAVIYPDGRNRLLLSRPASHARPVTAVRDIVTVRLSDFEALQTELGAGREGYSLHFTGTNNVLLVGFCA